MIRLLTSATTDLDADAHVRCLVAHVGAKLEDVVTAEWPLIARAGLRLMRRRRERGDVLVTVGAAALAATGIGWRGGRLVHVPVGLPSARERWILRRRRDVQVVASSMAAAEALNFDRVYKMGFAAEPATLSREDARRALGLSPGELTIALPGSIRNGSGHRIGIWACAILAFRDPSWRVVLSPRGAVDDMQANIAANLPPDRQHQIRIVDERDADAIVPAADIAVFCDEGVPELSAIEAAMRHGCAIVAPRAMWRRERLPLIDERGLFDVLRARDVARAILLVSESLEACRATPIEHGGIGEAWRQVLAR